MNNNTPEEILQSFRNSHSTDERAFIDLYDAYLEDPDSVSSQKLPADSNWSLDNYFFFKVIPYFEDSPVYQTVLNIAMHLIKIGESKNCIVNSCLSPVTPERILAIAEEYDIDQFTILKTICLCKGGSFDYGWNRKDNYRYGEETDIGDTYFEETTSEEKDCSIVETLLLNLKNEELSELLFSIPPQDFILFHAALAKHRPQKYKTYLNTLIEKNIKSLKCNWEFIIRSTDQLDNELIAYADQASKRNKLLIYTYIDHYRPRICREQAIQAARTSSCDHALLYLANIDANETSDFLYKVITAAQKLNKKIECGCRFDTGFKAAATVWKTKSNDPFAALLEPTPQNSSLWSQSYGRQCAIISAFQQILQANNISPEETKNWYQQAVQLINNCEISSTEKKEILHRFDSDLCLYSPENFQDRIWDILEDKSKTSRLKAVLALARINTPEIVSKARQQLSAKKMDARLGAIELLTELEEATPKDSNIPALKEAYATEKSVKVQNIILKSLHGLGCEDITPEGDETPDTIEGLLKSLDEQAKKIKLPKAPWLNLDSIAPLIGNNGKALPEIFITYMIQHQAKHKTIDASPLINPLLRFIDQSKSNAFVNDLLEQWLASDQEAKDRWVLALAGLLGNDSIITTLEPKIDPWCRNSRHKLAEYAAQAISLLASDSALMVLDSLKNRYSSKFKNVGRSCAAAFDAAAVARGVSVDELADMIVPDLGFNEEGQRPFETTESEIVAILQPDFKLTWLNIETDKETKSPPSTLSAEAKAEIKDLRKLIRTATKAQDMRLEQSLVTQRRWPVRRWQELFEEHPLLTSYASRLVWGIYDDKNTLLRSFRRYDNGILATGGGEMEDLEEDDTFIGILHPLELSEATKNEWLEHLGRFKIKPPFPQLDRPIELLDSNHGNRRQITLTDKISMSVGTFRSRTEKRNWNRGSVIDGGGVSSYYKVFAGAGVEVIVDTEDHWVAQDPMDYLTLGKALFAKIATVDRGSYVYDEPAPDDSRVLPFSEVPSIVYSEAISDLKAIVEGQS